MSTTTAKHESPGPLTLRALGEVMEQLRAGVEALRVSCAPPEARQKCARDLHLTAGELVAEAHSWPASHPLREPHLSELRDILRALIRHI